jgi:hypothetical protein
LATPGSTNGSEQPVGVAAGAVPFVQPGAPTSPFAFDQPPEYQAQSMSLPLSRSPIVGFVCAGSFAPNCPEGWKGGCIVLTPKSPQARPAIVVRSPHACVSGPSTNPVPGETYSGPVPGGRFEVGG